MIIARISQLISYLVAQIQCSQGGILLGRVTGAGRAQEITVGAGLTLADGELSVSGGEVFVSDIQDATGAGQDMLVAEDASAQRVLMEVPIIPYANTVYPSLPASLLWSQNGMAVAWLGSGTLTLPTDAAKGFWVDVFDIGGGAGSINLSASCVNRISGAIISALTAIPYIRFKLSWDGSGWLVTPIAGQTTYPGEALMNGATVAAQRTLLGLGVAQSPTFAGGTFSGQVKVPVGSSTAPSITDGSYTNKTGWNFTGGDVDWVRDGTIFARFSYESTKFGPNSLLFGPSVTGTNDLGFKRNAAGVGEINNGTAGTFRDLKLRGLTAEGGTITASTPAVNVSQIWNNSGITFVGKITNITDTASASGSLIEDWQVGGVSKLRFGKDGNFDFTPGNSGAWSFCSGSTGTLKIRNVTNSQDIVAIRGDSANGKFGLNSGVALCWGFPTTEDLYLCRDSAADTLAQRRGTNAQTSRIYGTFTARGAGTTNLECLEIKGQASGNFIITSMRGANGGTSRDIEFQHGASDNNGVISGGTVIARVKSTSLEIVAGVSHATGATFTYAGTTAATHRTALKVPASDITGISGADAITNIVSLTQAEYDAIGSPSASTLYVIV